jgi:hypothetical protein
MNVHRLSAPPAPSLARALAEFEEPFTYPLGPGRFFRISHGEDYTLFFRSQGDASCFIAEDQDRVVGTLATAIRQVRMPDGTERATAYFGDLKIAANARGGMVLARLARAAEAWLRPKVSSAFAVVMGGTSFTPEAYTGRAGIPGFEELGRIVVFRISGSDTLEHDLPRFVTNREAALSCYRCLSLGFYSCPVGEANQRSQITPVWLMSPDASACGMLEDTRKAKRLIIGDSSELLSAHLSCFAYASVSAAAHLITTALQHALRLGLPALFLSVPDTDGPALRIALRDFEILSAPAIIYGTGLRSGSWNINTSEI